MKYCKECKIHYHHQYLICPSCGNALEDRQYYKIIGISVFIAIVTQFLVMYIFGLKTPFLKEVFLYTTTYFFVIYGIGKFIQKVREPDRKIFREVSSLFSERHFRIILTLIGIVFLYILVRNPSKIFIWQLYPAYQVPDWFVIIWRIRTMIMFYTLIIYIIFTLKDQGLRFFNFKVRDSSIVKRDDIDLTKN